ncbi:hypothetical protein TrST_g1804 [Triparma strigata]|uniref:Uncharacterized protein n=1 Tax=Triparma strigata TaxID=1606541 RepID=A0A9W7BQH2_9STRA|nr:hypothetical protein TrST_g1804 [Triparma strigata]
MTAYGDESTIATYIAEDDLNDGSVIFAGGGGARGGLVRDKWGNIIRTCEIAGCQYKTGVTNDMKRQKAAKHGIDVIWFSCDQDGCDYKAKQATSNDTNEMFMILTCNGTTAIKTAATIRRRQRATSNDTNGMFMILTFDGTTVIKMGATTRQSKQAISNNTNSNFMILTFNGTSAIKTAATIRQSKQATSNYTNSSFMILTFDGFPAIK